MQLKLAGFVVLLFLVPFASTDPDWFPSLFLLEQLDTSQCSFPPPCDGYFITKAKILTFDPERPFATRMRTLGKHIAWVGNSTSDYLATVGSNRPRPCQIINAKNRRVGPAIWDSHVHLLRAASEAGCQIYEAENARGPTEFLASIQESLAQCEPDEIVAVTGGLNLASLGGAFPTIAELDALVPNQPFIAAQRYTVPNVNQIIFEGPGAVNTIMLNLLNDAGFALDADGAIPPNKLNAINLYLRSLLTPEERVVQHKRLFSYLHSKGIVGGLDMHGRDFFPLTEYDTARKLMRDQDLDVDIGLGIRAYDLPGGIAGTVNFTTSRIGSLLGENDALWHAGLGEFFFPPPSLGNEAGLTDAMQTVRNSGQKDEWAAFVNVEFPINLAGSFAALENVVQSHGIPEYQWSVEHCMGCNETHIQFLEDHKIFFSVDASRFLWGIDEDGFRGPPLRTAMQIYSDPLIALNTDGRNVSPINWWISAQFWVDGKNITGAVINGDETISIADAYKFGSYGNLRKVRQDAFRGTITPGKLADFVIWKDDPLTVPTSQIRFTESKTTFFRGRIVYSQ